MGKRAGSSFTCCLWRSTGKESALDGAEQAAPPGVVHVDAGAPWRSEEAALGVLFSQDTQDTEIQWSLFSWFHPAPQTVLSIWFPVVSRESRGVFLVCLGYLVLSTVHLSAISRDVHCRMFTSLHPFRRCVGKQTPVAPEVQLRDHRLVR